MSLFRPSRERRGPDPLFPWKISLFTLGAAFGLVGMFTETGWMVVVGIAALAAGALLRLGQRKED